MADINISELPSISSATNDDVFIINDANATTSRINWSQLKTSIDSLNADQVKFLSGTESNPSITFVGDLNTGIYNPGLDQLGIVTNGKSRFHIDAAGNIGIGNKTPSSYSTSLNNLVVGDLEGDNGIIISSSPSEAGAYVFSDSFSEFPGRIVYDHDDDHMHFEVDSLEKVRITQVGSVGIGTSSPQETLHVRSSVSGVTGTQSNLSGVIIEGGDTTDTGVQFFTPNDKSAGLFFSDPENFGIGHLKYDNVNNRFAFQTNNVESVYIDSTGSVGIGSVPLDRALSITKDATGSSSYSGIHISSAIQSDVNLDFRYFRSSAVTQGTSFNLIDLYHFSATQDTLGAGSTVTNQYGFAVDSGMTGAVNNYGFFSNLPQGANTYNFYSNGDADNYFNGNTFTVASGGVDGFVVADGIGTFGKGLVLTPAPSSGRPNPAVAGTLRYNSDFNNVEAYNGDAWGSIGGSIDTSPTPPTNSVNGDMWFDTEEGRTYVYYDDGDSTQWVEMNPSLNGGIANNSVTTSSLVDNAVTTPKIADGAVTDEKLAGDYVTEAPTNGISYVRRSAEWVPSAGSPSVSSSFPTATTVGQQFYNLDDGRLYIVIEDSSTNLVWVDASPDGGAGVEQIVAGSNITISPSNGKGVVTINSTGGGGSGGTTPGVRYQEGTWTPAPSVGTITSPLGTWSRVGNRVFIEGVITGFSESASASLIEILGAPYSRISTFSSQGAVRSRYLNFDDYITCSLTGSNLIRFYSVKSGDSATTMSYANIVNANKDDGQLMFALTYTTDDTTFAPINGATVTKDIQGTGGSGGGGSTDIYGTAKAWANVDQNATINNGFNVASVTKESINGSETGHYEVTFTTPMPNSTYAISIQTAASNATTAADQKLVTVTSQTAAGFKYTTTTTDARINCAVSFTVHDDQPVTVSGGGGGGTTVNYNGASAWASVAADGSLSNGQNIASITADSTKRYTVVFKTPMPNANYSIVGSGGKLAGGATGYFSIYDDGSKSVNGFTYYFATEAGGTIATEANFAVFAENTIAPQSGVGADAWGRFNSLGTDIASYNCSVVAGSNTYDVTFNTPMPSSAYSVTANTYANNGLVKTDSQTADGFRVVTYDSTGSPLASAFCFTVHASSTVTPTYTWTRNGTTLEPANAGDTVVADCKTTGSSGSSGAGQVVGYQQGLWVPVGNAPFSIAYNADRCIWSRIGNTVFLCAYISTVSAGTTGAAGLNISGMPYPVTVNGNYGSVMSQKLGIDCNAAYISATAQVLQPYQSSAGAWQSVSLTDVNSAGNNGQIYLQATYFTDDTTFVPQNGATLS